MKTFRTESVWIKGIIADDPRAYAWGSATEFAVTQRQNPKRKRVVACGKRAKLHQYQRFVIGILFAVIVFGSAVVGHAQGRVDTSSMRDRQRARQRAIEDPRNNPIKFEPYEPLKPQPQPEPAPLRAIVELQVVSVEDGDTLIISNTANQYLRLRLQGIDAPETGQGFWIEAKNNLYKLTSGKAVSVEFDPHGKPDSNGRVVAKVYLDGNDIAFEQIRAGFAWFCKDYKKVQTESDRYRYAEAEKEARAAGLGLWREKSPKAPWDFRKQ